MYYIIVWNRFKNNIFMAVTTKNKQWVLFMANFLSDSDFDKYKTLIYSKSGISFSEANRSVLESRIKEKLYSLKLITPEEYFQTLLGDEEELKAFLDLVTTNLTQFFRNPPHFEALVNVILPNLVDYKNKYFRNDRKIKIWSAGCSTGEEPYSLAIQLNESLPKEFEYEIYASDLSLKSLIKAKEGIYSKKKIYENVPREYIDRYFVDLGDNNLQVTPFLKSKVHFDYHNLKHKSHFNDLDIIFCRNVLIYFDEASQKNTLMHFWDAMNDYSFLFIGHSESLFALDVPFKYYKTPYTILYIKNIKRDMINVTKG